MKVTAIIAEYNPFHQGHQRQLEYLKRRDPSALRLILMSGAFVQRGEPAIVNKFIRAQWAIMAGADLVLELPAPFAVSNSERFAAGAVRLLARLGVQSLCFGSEQGDASTLIEIAKTLRGDEAQKRIAQGVKQGMSYHQALSLGHGDLGQELGPNDRLAVQYIKAAMDYKLPMDYLVCHRTSDYHGLELAPLCSATALRESIRQGDFTQSLAYVPPCTASSLSLSLQGGHYTDYERYHDALLLSARRYTAEQWQSIADCVEGLENRLVDCSLEASWEAMRLRLKTKRYSYGRLDRILAYGLLGWTKDFVSACHQEGPQYGRILAFNDRARDFLRRSYDIPLVTKWQPFVKSSRGLTVSMAHGDTMAAQVQAYCMRNEGDRQGRQDYVTGPYFHKE